MTNAEAIMEKIRGNMSYLQERYKVKNVGVFGSYIRGDNNKESDVDILVEFHEPPTLLEFVALERHIGELAGMKVDLVMRTALKPGIGERILQEVVYVSILSQFCSNLHMPQKEMPISCGFTEIDLIFARSCEPA